MHTHSLGFNLKYYMKVDMVAHPFNPALADEDRDQTFQVILGHTARVMSPVA